MKYILIFCVLGIVHSTMYGQQGATERYRYAQALEQSGDQRSAARIYQELYDERPTDGKYYDGVVRTLSALGQYASLVPIVEARAAAAPSVPLINQLALVQWKAGMKTTAAEQWQRATNMAGGVEEALVVIGETQLQAGAVHAALSTFERARKANGDSRAYAFNLGKIALATGDVARAASEFIEDYKDRGDLLQTQGQIGAIMASPEGVLVVREKLRGDESEVLRLRMWFHQEVKEWQQAMMIAKQLDEQVRAGGQELYAFAERARRDGQYDAALEAFGQIADMPRVSDQWRKNALYMYVRTLHQRVGNKGGKVNEEDARKIITRYSDYEKRNPTSPEAANALYHMGVLQGDVLQNRDEARSTMQKLMNTWQGTPAAADAAMYIADLAIMADQLGFAVQILQNVEALRSTPELAMRIDMATVKRADILAWQGNLDSARLMYMKVAANAGSSASNDAFERLMTLQLTDEDSTTRLEILAGDRLTVARRLDLAAKRYEAAAATAKEPELRDRCLWRAATSWFQHGNTVEAERQAEKIVKDIPESIVGDRALMLVANIREAAGDNNGAMKALTDLLTYYPTSILVTQARERLRQIRGDAKG
jgi:tetratricopeptide (TPR) repeat protein